ncbi:SOUL heme-binding protein [Sphingomonas oleivorans]|uniref:SOUL heme-binding protein n=1 Tax=Sphingomonas oleivorans TaxID=1735121 RepID=A0A2T5G047_9SPHN|nr:heme-binding protein [Sphingomonas oleivorans]PTQ12315.1 SOUL heme-binding protein [Sphingomonas oleivorans]
MAQISLGKMLGIVAGGVAAGAALLWLREQVTESPNFETIETDGAFEIRDYPAMLVAETVQGGSRDRALGTGFGLLADYAFAETRGGEEVAMTVPVFAAPLESGDWRIRFAIPMGWTRETLPEPGPDVTIVEVPPRRMAAIRFGGRADDKTLAAKERELRDWLAKTGRTPVGRAEHALYNSPVMPGPLRHNEVHIALA